MQVGRFRTITAVLPAREQERPRYEPISGKLHHYDRRIVAGPTPGETGQSQRVGTLRGAGVEVETRRVGQAFLVLVVVGLAVLVVILSLAGFRKNSQITRLQQHGVPVEVTVSSCLGLLGGSGSNPAGYACRGTFTIDGHRYADNIPGNVQRLPGTKVRAVTVRDDPGLLETAHTLADEHPSGTVYIVPTILLVVLALLLAAIALRRRHLRRED